MEVWVKYVFFALEKCWGAQQEAFILAFTAEVIILQKLILLMKYFSRAIHFSKPFANLR